MELLMVGLFVGGYIVISLEHPLRLNKSSTALLLALLLWTILAVSGSWGSDIHSVLSEHLIPIAEIIFFLMGAMAIVEVIDSHQGFAIITDRIKTRNKRTLLVILGTVSFLLSSVLDNLATTIVMMAITMKLT